MNKKRNCFEWHNAIFKIINKYDNDADYCAFYTEIPIILNPLTERELKGSGIKQEATWRGTLRGYLSHMVRDGLLIKICNRSKISFKKE